MALALGAEKMNIADKAKAFALFEAGWDVTTRRGELTLVQMGAGIEPPQGSESDKPYSGFMDIYAALAAPHMETHGTTPRQIAAVSAKNHGTRAQPVGAGPHDLSVDEILGRRRSPGR